MRKITRLLLSVLALPAAAATVQPYRLHAQTIPAPTLRKTYSVLSLGPTLKVSVTENGVYKITYEDLTSHNLLSQPVAVEKIAVYGNVSGMQPYYNSSDIYDDLASLPLYVHDENGDGLFGPGDWLNFYGESQNRFTTANFSGEVYPFEFEKNHYSDKTFYFVGTHGEYASRPEPQVAPDGSPEVTVSNFTEHLLYEKDEYNLCSGGVNFYGNRMSNDGSTESFSFSLPGAVSETPARLYVKTVASTGTLGSGSIVITAGSARDTAFHNRIPLSACYDIRERNLQVPLSGSNLTVRLTYSKSSNAGNAYLDRAILYYMRSLNPGAGSLCFRHPQSFLKSALFRLSSTVPTLKVWDVTDIYAIKEPSLTRTGSNTYTFQTDPDMTLHEYVAFDPATCPTPLIEGTVQAQNLHAERDIDYVMVSHPDFLEQALEISKLHAEQDGYSVLTVTTDEVYNEFSSGAKDPSAIRLLMRHLWKISDSTRRPRYLCLMGATFYDYRNISGDGYDFIPTFQSYNNTDVSEHGGDPVEDNFGYLEDNEGISPVSYIRQGKMDIGVGRLPVRTREEAEAVLEKIRIYSSPVAVQNVQPGTGASNFGDWRNEITVVTDDWFEQFMERMILRKDDYFRLHPEYHINKLYSDCYLRNSTSTSTRVPELENAIRNRIENGSLFIGYEGHSGPDAWSDEKIITAEIIDNLAVSYSYPIMTASSCSFALFDQGTQVSGAEKLVLHPRGGAIAVMGTMRSATQNNIEDIHSRFLYALSDKNASEHPTIGSAFLTAKRNNIQGAGFKFVLLGDPGLKTALPRYNVETLKINGKNTSMDADAYADSSGADNAEMVAVDTLRALSTVTVEGCITGPDGRILSGFNGSVVAKVYDKAITSQTLGLFNSREHFNNPVVSFTTQNSLIFQGVSQVDSGRFSFSFIVPKDIMYDYGFGKITYYAWSDTADANGAFTRVMVGGFNSDAVLDTLPPVVRLRIGGENSIGTTVGENPVLYAEISDEYGINTTGSGIGHDMELVIDGDEANPVVVNSLFRYDFGSYKSGGITYPLGELTPGGHTAKLKVWNINNISATATIAFTVGAGGRTEIFDLTAAPNPNRGDYVDFYFTHNGEAGSITECQILVFDLMGKRIADLHYDMEGSALAGGGMSAFGNGHAVGPLRWEISQSGVRRLEAGIYICRVLVTGSNGKKVGESVKLVVM